MLEVTNLTKRYRDNEALRGVSFRAEHGQVTGLLGPNGAGKSTVMNIISGVIPNSGGVARVCGVDVGAHPKDAKRHIGYLPEQAPLYVNMTVDEFLDFSSDIKKVPKPQKGQGIDYAVEATNLTDVRRRLIRNLSKGYRQRIGLAQALIGSPEVLVLDEPTNGLDPSQIIEMRALIKELGKSRTVLFSSHLLAEAELICDRVVVLHKGRILADGEPAALVPSKSERRFMVSVQALSSSERIRTALADAGIEATEVASVGASLEDAFMRLILKAEQEAES